jgi:hypothetical protein
MTPVVSLAADRVGVFIRSTSSVSAALVAIAREARGRPLRMKLGFIRGRRETSWILNTAEGRQITGGE